MEILAMLSVTAVVIALAVFAKRLRDNPEVPLPVDGEMDAGQGADLLCEELDDSDVKIAPGGDEDVKIADNNLGNKQSNKQSNKDYADIAADEFLKQKEAGNIEVAKRFGSALADMLWENAQELIMQGESAMNSGETHQIILLKNYVTNVFAGENLPSPLLSEMTMSEFYLRTEEISEVLYKHLRDFVAYSLYILNHRSSTKEVEAGEIYAKLSNMEDDPVKIAEGNQIFEDYYNKCADLMHEGYSFKA